MIIVKIASRAFLSLLVDLWYRVSQFGVIVIVQDPHIRKLNKNCRSGHDFLYFFNAIFLLAWTLGR